MEIDEWIYSGWKSVGGTAGTNSSIYAACTKVSYLDDLL